MKKLIVLFSLFASLVTHAKIDYLGSARYLKNCDKPYYEKLACNTTAIIEEKKGTLYIASPKRACNRKVLITNRMTGKTITAIVKESSSPGRWEIPPQTAKAAGLKMGKDFGEKGCRTWTGKNFQKLNIRFKKRS